MRGGELMFLFYEKSTGKVVYESAVFDKSEAKRS